jgi:hypothetical protein
MSNKENLNYKNPVQKAGFFYLEEQSFVAEGMNILIKNQAGK